MLLSEAEARELTAEIQKRGPNTWDLVRAAYQGRVWVAMGYESWAAYCAGISREDRDTR